MFTVTVTTTQRKQAITKSNISKQELVIWIQSWIKDEHRDTIQISYTHDSAAK